MWFWWRDPRWTTSKWLVFIGCMVWSAAGSVVFLLALIHRRADPYVYIWVAMLVLPLAVGGAGYWHQRRN